MAATSIEWTKGDDGSLGMTWNPTVGCTRFSEGCRNCYAFALHDMRHDAYKNGKQVPEQYAKPFKELQLMTDRIDAPLHWKKPRRVFVNSMSDLFHEDVPDEFIDRVFATMAVCPQHTFQILTKRAERLPEYFRSGRQGRVNDAAIVKNDRQVWFLNNGDVSGPAWPLLNVAIGVSIENPLQMRRLYYLAKTPAAIRFVSAEPLLAPLDFREQLETAHWTPGIDWVIVGGESGPEARPCNLEWISNIVRQCKVAATACFVKQWGSRPFIDTTGGSRYDDHTFHKLKDKKGGDPLEWPEKIRVRQFPTTRTTCT